jgi:hypothetical protein
MFGEAVATRNAGDFADTGIFRSPIHGDPERRGPSTHRPVGFNPKKVILQSAFCL